MTIQYVSLVFVFLAWLLSLAGTAMAIPFLSRHGIVDKPNERSNHAVPVPRGGGIAMVTAMLLILAFYGIDIRIFFGALLLMGVSFIDDARGVPVRWRLVVQAVAVTLAVSSVPLQNLLYPYDAFWLPFCLIIGLFWMWFINLTNFMDGIDGITSMQVIMMAVGICMVGWVDASVPQWLSGYAVIIAASVLGFYWFNSPPAKIFMGDVGSITLGFLVCYLLIVLALNGAFFAAFILPAYYLGDAGFTLLKRFKRGEKLWKAHSEHAYQQAVRRGLSHQEVVKKITALNVFLDLLAMFSTYDITAGVAMIFIAYAVTAYMIKHLIMPE